MDNPFLDELETLANSDDPEDQRQLQRMTYRTLIYVVKRLDQIVETTDRLSEEGQLTKNELERVKNMEGQVQENTERIEMLEATGNISPSLLTIARRHPFATMGAVFILLALLVWFLNLPPDAIRDFFGIVR